MININEIDIDAGCDESGNVIIDDSGLDEVAEYFAEMANKHNDNDDYAETQKTAEMAVYTAISNPDLIAKIYKQICL